jgi:hypothetical protein
MSEPWVLFKTYNIGSKRKLIFALCVFASGEAYSKEFEVVVSAYLLSSFKSA